ncbi:hypothetical protein DFH11DRAFT_632911 [Phellopilus nigrolimitatus]|nr:hypothetical protein DFH11DRAFT_632911 [Phellopilus nigrolimitatus]
MLSSPAQGGKYSFIPLALSPSKGKAYQKAKEGTRTRRSKEGLIASSSTLAEPSSPDVPLDEIHSFDGLNASTISTSPVAGPSYIPSIGRNDDFDIAADRSQKIELDFGLDSDAGDEFQREPSPPLPAILNPSWKKWLLPCILHPKVTASAPSESDRTSTGSHGSTQADGYSTPPSSFGFPSPSTSSLYSPLPLTYSKHFHQFATVQRSGLHSLDRSEAVATRRRNLKQKAEE